MCRLAIVVLALAAVSIQARPHSEEAELVCNDVPDGYYANLSNKAEFFSCYEGNLVAKVVCDEGFEYDGHDDCVRVQEDSVETLEVQEEETAETEEVKGEIDDNASDLNIYQDDDDDYVAEGNGDFGQSKPVPKVVINKEYTRNFFPKSLIIIGRMNREQKNK